jgi:hypothetical protein
VTSAGVYDELADSKEKPINKLNGKKGKRVKSAALPPGHTPFSWMHDEELQTGSGAKGMGCFPGQPIKCLRLY